MQCAGDLEHRAQHARADVVERARHHEVPVIPGAVTPSELMAAQALGLTTVKFFPASVSTTSSAACAGSSGCAPQP